MFERSMAVWTWHAVLESVPDDATLPTPEVLLTLPVLPEAMPLATPVLLPLPPGPALVPLPAPDPALVPLPAPDPALVPLPGDVPPVLLVPVPAIVPDVPGPAVPDVHPTGVPVALCPTLPFSVPFELLAQAKHQRIPVADTHRAPGDLIGNQQCGYR
jgi:hypothetical protein